MLADKSMREWMKLLQFTARPQKDIWRTIPVPKNPLRARCYGIASSPYFDNFIMSIIMANVLVMVRACVAGWDADVVEQMWWNRGKACMRVVSWCSSANTHAVTAHFMFRTHTYHWFACSIRRLLQALPHEGSTPTFEDTLAFFNAAFTLVFIFEAVVKNMAMGPRVYIKVGAAPESQGGGSDVALHGSAVRRQADWRVSKARERVMLGSG